jgi:hypothetical protein
MDSIINAKLATPLDNNWVYLWNMFITFNEYGTFNLKISLKVIEDSLAGLEEGVLSGVYKAWEHK